MCYFLEVVCYWSWLTFHLEKERIVRGVVRIELWTPLDWTKSEGGDVSCSSRLPLFVVWRWRSDDPEELGGLHPPPPEAGGAAETPFDAPLFGLHAPHISNTWRTSPRYINCSSFERWKSTEMFTYARFSLLLFPLLSPLVLLSPLPSSIFTLLFSPEFPDLVFLVLILIFLLLSSHLYSFVPLSPSTLSSLFPSMASPFLFHSLSLLPSSSPHLLSLTALFIPLLLDLFSFPLLSFPIIFLPSFPSSPFLLLSFSSLFSVLCTCSFFHFLSSYLPSQLISPVSFLSSCLPALLLTILPPFFSSFSPPSPSCQECIECVLDLQALRQALLSPRQHSVSGMRRWPLALLLALCDGSEEPPGCSAPRGVGIEERDISHLCWSDSPQDWAKDLIWSSDPSGQLRVAAASVVVIGRSVVIISL